MAFLACVACRGDGPEGPETEVADLRYGYLQKLEDSHKKVRAGFYKAANNMLKY